MNDGFLDAIAIVSFLIGVMNLDLNTQQVSSLDRHLEQQDAVLKEEREAMLSKIIAQNDRIAKLLEGLLNAQKDT
jgi:hypothetical protein